MSIKKIVIACILIAIALWVLATLTKKESKYISWQEAQVLFSNCKVDSIIQAQTLDVTLNLNDGSVAYSKAPSITSVGELITNNASSCGEVQIDTTGY